MVEQDPTWYKNKADEILDELTAAIEAKEPANHVDELGNEAIKLYSIALFKALDVSS